VVVAVAADADAVVVARIAVARIVVAAVAVAGTIAVVAPAVDNTEPFSPSLHPQIKAVG
jgi:hypothetical protein